MAEVYFDETTGAAGSGALSALAAAIETAFSDPGDVYEQMDRLVMKDPAHGPLAKSLIELWFTGSWNALDQLWHAQNGGDPQDISRVVSAEAYKQGLVWPNIGSHPQAAKQPGFGTWAFPPPPFQE